MWIWLWILLWILSWIFHDHLNLPRQAKTDLRNSHRNSLRNSHWNSHLQDLKFARDSLCRMPGLKKSAKGFWDLSDPAPKKLQKESKSLFYRRRTNVQQLTCKIDLPFSFYSLFFSFVLLELKPFVLKGKVLGEKLWKNVKIVKKVWKLWNDFAL